ncbi:MAG: hypothetical protein M3Q07_23065, partial [Pseudobdellovibrionaceae bacterium]|nr:hypothetical protein [Pseudobdellovibrionaceae bacterium]
MAISTFDLFKIGIGPSSSHTVGPMRAGHRFLMGLEEKGVFDQVASVTCELYGSLALTGIGHGTDKAIMLGLSGEQPDQVDPETIDGKLDKIRGELRLYLKGQRPIEFDPKKHIIFFRKKVLPLHSNGMRFIAFDANYKELHSRVYYSIGGGFVVNEDTAKEDRLKKDTTQLKYPFHSAAQLLEFSRTENITIANIMFENEKAWRTDAE